MATDLEARYTSGLMAPRGKVIAFVSVLFMSVLLVGVAGVANVAAQAEPPSSARESSRPPSGLWGEALQDGTDKGLKKATGSPYNYTHLALSAGVVAIAALGLFMLVRRQTADRD